MMLKGRGGIPMLTWAAMSYLDWFWYIDHKDNDGAEGSYSDYLFYKQKIMDAMAGDMPHMSPVDVEAYVTGMVDGYIEAMTDE